LDKVSLDDLRDELATLEAAESRISAERRRLHEQIDFGYATAATRVREREISAERRQLHRRIDSLREVLRARDPLADSEKDPTAREPKLPRLSEWTGISADVVAADDASSEELEL
jgi:uncharacterized membrane protein YccC